MTRTFRIHVQPECPTLQLVNKQEQDILLPLDGTPKAKLMPDRPISAHFSAHANDGRCDFASVDGNLAIKESTRNAHKELYYCVMGCEQILLKANEEYYYLINPGVLRPEYGAFGIRALYEPIFRLEGRPRSELYCVEDVPNVEWFKQLYDQFGLAGLAFVQVASDTKTA